VLFNKKVFFSLSCKTSAICKNVKNVEFLLRFFRAKNKTLNEHNCEHIKIVQDVYDEIQQLNASKEEKDELWTEMFGPMEEDVEDYRSAYQQCENFQEAFKESALIISSRKREESRYGNSTYGSIKTQPYQENRVRVPLLPDPVLENTLGTPEENQGGNDQYQNQMDQKDQKDKDHSDSNDQDQDNIDQNDQNISPNLLIMEKSTNNPIEEEGIGIKLGSINVNAIEKKHLSIQALCDEETIEILAIAEPKVHKKSFLPKIDGYKTYAHLRENSLGGAVLYIHDTIRCKRLDIKPPEDSEVVWVAVGEGNHQVAIASVYLHCGLRQHVKENVFQNLSDGIMACREMNMPIIMLGDFNAHIGNDEKGLVDNPISEIRGNGDKFRELIETHNGVIWNQLEFCEGVRTRNESANKKWNAETNSMEPLMRAGAIDYIISFGERIEPKEMVIDENREKWTRSDHNLLLAECNLAQSLKSVKMGFRWVYRFQDMDEPKWRAYAHRIDQYMMEIPGSPLCFEDHTELTIQEVYEKMVQCFQIAGQEMVAGGMVRFPPQKKRMAPFKDKAFERVKALRQLRVEWRNRDSEAKKKQGNGDPRNQIGDIYAQNQVKDHSNLIRHIENMEYEEGVVTKSHEMLGGKNRNKFFEHVRKLQKDDAGEITMRDKEGKIITDLNILKGEMEEFVESVYKWRPFPEAEATWAEEAPIAGIVKGSEDIPRLNEVLDMLKNLETSHKSTGYSDIPPMLLKKMGLYSSMTVTWWIQRMWKEETTPKQIAWSLITMLHKKGRISDIKNYRTLQVGCNLCKLYLRGLEKRITKIAEACNLLSEQQSGFRAGRRCQDNLMVLDTLIEECKRNKGKKLFMAFLDITKAYDKVDRDILWHKLEKMGIPGKIIRLVQESYKDPRGTATFQGATTDALAMPIGLKQGCVMSPILFALYMADLLWRLAKSGLGPTLKWKKYKNVRDPNSANKTIQVEDGYESVQVPAMAFADDLAIMEEEEQKMQSLLDIIVDWSQKNRVEFAGLKSMVIPFGTTINPARKWSMGVLHEWDGSVADNIIPEVETTRYLGCFLRRTHPTYQPLAIKAKQKMGMVCSFIKNIAIRTSHPAYYGGAMWKIYAVPMVTYALDVCHIPWKYIKEFEEKHKELMRNLSSLPRGTALPVLYAETGGRPIIFDLMQYTMSFWSYVMKLPNTRLVKAAVLHQINIYNEKGWNIFRNPKIWLHLWDQRGFKNNKFWLKWLAECAQGLDMALDKIHTKDEIRERSQNQWEWTYHDLIKRHADSSLKWYQDRLFTPWVDINYLPHSAMKWWLRAKCGQAPDYEFKKFWCPCNGNLSKVSLEHLLTDCVVVKEVRDDWQSEFAVVLGYDRRLEPPPILGEDFLSVHQPPKTRIAYGELVKRVIAKWRKTFLMEPGQAPPKRESVKKEKVPQHPLGMWNANGWAGTTKGNEKRLWTQEDQDKPLIMYAALNGHIPILPKNCGKQFIKLVPGVEGRFKDPKGGWQHE
jgi:exonuclease III